MKRAAVFALALVMALGLCACGGSRAYYQQRVDLCLYGEPMDGFTDISLNPEKSYITVSGGKVTYYYFENIWTGQWLKDDSDKFILWDEEPQLWSDFEYGFTTMKETDGGYTMSVMYTDDIDGDRVWLEYRIQFRTK